MINLQRFKNYEEFLEYSKNSIELLEEVTLEVEEIEDCIRGNDDYLVNLSKEEADNLDRDLSEGKINLFRYHALINFKRFDYVRYLLELFSSYPMHILYAELVCDTIRMGRIIDKMYTKEDVSEEAVAAMNEKIFEDYKLTLSN